MYAELAINIEAPLVNTFHYFIPFDLEDKLQLGHLVEVEFGRRLAQAIVVNFDTHAPVDDTKPIISLIDDIPVLYPWQIDLARWLHINYLAPLNACLRLMLPPGLTRWADITVDINPRWDGSGRLTDLQTKLLDLLRDKGDLRGRQLKRYLKGEDWKKAVDQLARRDILRKASVLDPPRARPKTIRTAELIAPPARQRQALLTFGRKNKQATILTHLLLNDDPLPAEQTVIDATNATDKHLTKLAKANLITRTPEQTLILPANLPPQPPANYAPLLANLPTTDTTNWLPEQIDHAQAEGWITLVPQPATIALAVPPDHAFEIALKKRGATTYLTILRYLAQAAQPVNISDLYSDLNCNINHLRRLVKADLIRFGSEEVWRDPLADRDFVPHHAPPLTHDQARVWGHVKINMIHTVQAETDEELPPPILLHGVTGSGKTEIYMRAIDYAIQEGKTAIVLVPEIALTPQTVRRFAARFPGQVAIWHSRLSQGERYDTWRRARAGLIDIVVGPRSALFAPLNNLGIIIVDEEHDPSYKQTPPVPPPYYHTRAAAVALGRRTRATVILGSATPDLVAYHQAQNGRYQLLELAHRVMGHRDRLSSQETRLGRPSQYQHHDEDPEETVTIPLPPIQLVDLRQELRAGNRSIFSRALQSQITTTLERNEQIILFLNRRGTASFVICRDCGESIRCPNCDLPLTYHRPHLALTCHHCGHRENHHTTCPQCDSRRIKHFGLGTEEVEYLVNQQWPHARTVRWDRDTTAGKNKHETLLASFINHESDILIGTQMIAKGLDLPLVTLVGVISADVSLGMPDYRTGERAFQILTQVAGRAGRGLLGGRVIIQTYQPEHYAIQAAAEHDYLRFYLAEIRFRTQHRLPPFRRLARLVITDFNADKGRREAERVAKALRHHIRELSLGATDLLGPVPPFFNRLDRRYRWQIIVRSPDPVRLLADFPLPKPWILDIDPDSTL
ncbi:MAG TPA: primosomal protein N' [Anaerolineae bacterium]|nr:primosomal protein N' [Anaerolineae bacterium]